MISRIEDTSRLIPAMEVWWQVKKKRPIAIMLMAFGDESSDEQEQFIFAVAGLVGTREEWNEVAARWSGRTGGVTFHASDCQAGQGAYKEMPNDERDALYIDLVHILMQTKIMVKNPLQIEQQSILNRTPSPIITER